MAEKKLGSDGNCARKIKTFLYRIKWTKYKLKLQKSESYLLQMENSRNDRHQSPYFWFGFCKHFS